MNLLKKILEKNYWLQAEICKKENIDIWVVKRASEWDKITHNNAFKIYMFLVERNFFTLQDIKLPELFEIIKEEEND